MLVNNGPALSGAKSLRWAARMPSVTTLQIRYRATAIDPLRYLRRRGKASADGELIASQPVSLLPTRA